MAVGPYGALLESVRGVRWPARHSVAGGAPGAHAARSRGVATEFVEYRPYRQGDDPKRIDWKLLARSDRAFIRLAPDRAVLGTLVLVDASASMDFPRVAHASSARSTNARSTNACSTNARSKWRCAREIAVGCVAIAHAGADPVGLAVVGGGGVARLTPRTRRGVVAEAARTIDAVTPSGTAALEQGFVGAPARVLVVTDCLGDVDLLVNTARAHVAGGGEVFVAHVVSRGELDPAAGAQLAVDPEDPMMQRPLTKETRSAYTAAFAAWRQDTARRWRDAGVGYAEICDDEPMDVAIRHIVAPVA